jgi:predicted nucleotidyltransferase
LSAALIDEEKKMREADTARVISDSIKKVVADKAEFALLFGSIVSDRFSSESDIDIGIYCKGGEISFEKKLDITLELESATNREIDLILLNASDLIITMQILANGKLIINHDPGLFLLFKAQKISEYIDFKRDRKIVEDHLLTRRIYA